MPPTFQILYGDFNKFPGFKLWIKVLNVTYQMKSLQWQQNVGCLKNLGMNLWSLTSDIFFFFRAPFLARNLRNKNYVYFSIFQLLILPWCVNYLLPRHRGLVLVRVLGHAGPPLRLSQMQNMFWNKWAFWLNIYLEVMNKVNVGIEKHLGKRKYRHVICAEDFGAIL